MSYKYYRRRRRRRLRTRFSPPRDCLCNPNARELLRTDRNLIQDVMRRKQRGSYGLGRG